MCPTVEKDHEETATHHCCNERLKKEGEEARCCICNKHNECGYDKIDEGIKPL